MTYIVDRFTGTQTMQQSVPIVIQRTTVIVLRDGTITIDTTTHTIRRYTATETELTQCSYSRYVCQLCVLGL